MDDALGLLIRLSGYGVIVLELALAVVAVAKLRLTPAGVLFGLGFGGIALKSLIQRVVFAVHFQPELETGGYDEVMMQMQAFTLLMSMAGVFLWILIGVGGLLLPSSLRRK